MNTLTPAQIASYIRGAGFPEELVPKMTAVALAESSGNPRAHNPNASTGDNSYGLLQVNMLGGMGPERRRQFGIASNEELFDPATNARAAKAIFDSQGIGAWSVTRGGANAPYLRYMDQARQGAAAALQQLPSGSASTPSMPPMAAPGQQLGGIPTAALGEPGSPEAIARAMAGTTFGDAYLQSLGLQPTARTSVPGREFMQSNPGQPFAGGAVPNIAGAIGMDTSTLPSAGGIGDEMIDLVTLGHKIQDKAGLRVREHPEFGGVGQHSPNSLHYSGKAFDITDWQDPGESKASWLPRKKALEQSWSQILGPSAEIYGPSSDPKGHGTHIHLGLPSGQISRSQAQQLIQARQQVLRQFPFRWAG